MAVDISKQGTKGGDQHYDTSQLRGVREERGIVTGIVKANVHGAHMGVIKIWVPTFSTNPDDRSQWRTVRYCTPFYSRVDNQGVGDTYLGTKVTSGIVTPPPDLGTKVLAFFPEGRNAEGYYFACVPDTFMLQSVPEASASNGQAGGEFNDIPQGTHSSKEITNWKKQTRPVDYFTQDQLVRSGLSADTVRGLSTSSYMRESPSELIGISSKGRRVTTDGQDFTLTYNSDIKDPNTTNKTILNGLLGPTARRKGHSITLDDGDIDGNSNQIRLRTSTGHQILMNDTTGVMYVGTGDGTCWIELSNNGTMDVYATDSINFRSKNIQFHADENIKFHSKGYTQIVSETNMHVEGKQQLVLTSKGEAGITGEKGLHLKSNSELFATSSGASYINSGGIMSVAGSLILLQGPKTQAKTAKNVNELQKEDTTFIEDIGEYILDEEQMVTTTADRIVTHEPFPYHGVKNTTSAYTGGLLGGGGGGFGAAFSIIGAVAGPLAAGSTSIPTGLDGGLAAAVNNVTQAATSSGAGSFLSGVDGGLVSAVVNQVGSNPVLQTAVSAALASTGVGAPIAAALQGSGGAGALLGAISGNAIPGSLASNVLSQVTGGGAGNMLAQLTGGNPGFSALTDSLSGGQLGGLVSGFTDSIGGANFDSITSQFGDITSSLPIGDLQNTFSSAASEFAGADFGKLVTDGTGKITGLTDALSQNLPEVAAGFNKVVPQFQDSLPELLNTPALKEFPITDMIQQANNGFSVGALDSFDIQGLNAAVVKQVGSGNNPAFIDSVTKSVGKFGFNVDQLKSQGFVRPDAVFNDQLADASVWTGKEGVSSLNKFLGNSGIQEQIQQGVVAGDYQKMFNQGAIKVEDSKKEIMGMLTASNISSPEVAAKVRQGVQEVEGTLKNTTNIPDSDDVATKVKEAIQTGAAASQRVDQIKGASAEQVTSTTPAQPRPKVRVQDESRAGESRAREETIARLTKQLADGEAAGTLSEFNKARIKANIVANRAALDALNKG